MPSVLNEQWRIADLEISNRMVMAPMSTNRADPGGHVTPSLIHFLVRRARGGCGMIILESATTDSVMGGTHNNLSLDDDKYIRGMSTLVSTLHKCNTRVVAQLWHAGPRAKVKMRLPFSPSGSAPGLPASNAMEVHEIENVILKFVAAAKRAAQIGFDALEIHAAHGYLLHQFVNSRTNRRHDAYGGSIKHRYNILHQIRHGIKTAYPRLPVILRISLSPDEDLRAIGGAIQQAGYDAVDLRTGFSSMPECFSGTKVPAGYILPIASALRPHLDIPLLGGGRILTPKQAEEAITDAGLDAVILGRALLADPDWCIKALHKEDIHICQYDCTPSCYDNFKEGNELHCLFYSNTK